MRLLLSRYPDQVTGASRWDVELLRHTRDEGTSVERVLRDVMASNRGGPDPVGDVYLAGRLGRLADAGLAHPPLEFASDRSSFRAGRIRLTATGGDALAGRSNLVDLNGVDDWVAGVHLDSRQGGVWFVAGALWSPGTPGEALMAKLPAPELRVLPFRAAPPTAYATELTALHPPMPPHPGPRTLLGIARPDSYRPGWSPSR